MSNTRLPLLPAFGLILGMLIAGPALAQSLPYNQNQSNYTFKSRHGSFEFTGKAIKRAGNYITFRTTDRTEIWLPAKYLSEESLAYLQYLSGHGPAPAGITATPMGTPPGSASTGMMSGSSGGSSPGRPTKDGTSTPNDPKPADPGMGDPDKIYAPGTAIDVLVDSQWYPGKVFARRPADNAYFVSYTVDGRPKSAWIPAIEIRPQGEEQSTSDEPKEDSDDDMSSSD
ncbi:hypothetical protein AB1K70_09460 [Bremerella sp. JC770]|uniref:hypothetical protein n=1 Tax=Bremerella sp. JC770 TaxID=3232137 RepID=UPI003459CAD0